MGAESWSRGLLSLQWCRIVIFEVRLGHDISIHIFGLMGQNPFLVRRIDF